MKTFNDILQESEGGWATGHPDESLIKFLRRMIAFSRKIKYGTPEEKEFLERYANLLKSEYNATGISNDKKEYLKRKELQEAMVEDFCDVCKKPYSRWEISTICDQCLENGGYKLY